MGKVRDTVYKLCVGNKYPDIDELESLLLKKIRRKYFLRKLQWGYIMSIDSTDYLLLTLGLVCVDKYKGGFRYRLTKKGWECGSRIHIKD